MDSEQRAFVENALTASVVELFASYGVQCIADAQPAPAADAELSSIIGFRGKDLRGGLAFVVTSDLAAELLPVSRSPEQPELQLRDWSAEMSNQLLGRLKNKLAAKAIDFKVGSPACFTGRSVRLVFMPARESFTLTFRVAAGTARIHLDCSIREGVPFDLDIQDLRIVAEGDVLLF